MLPLLILLLACPILTGPTKPAAGGEKRGPPPISKSWAPRATNVLVLLLDDVGTNAVKLYGEHPDAARTPIITSLANDGVLFRNAYTYPTCSPARAALLTGRYGRRTGVGDAIGPTSSWRMPHEEITIPEMLARAPGRWRSAALGKWHLAGHDAPGWKRDALDQGFSTHRGAPDNLFTYGYGLQDASYDKYEKLVDGKLSVHTRYATTDTVNDAIAAIDSMPEPWLTWVAFHGAHSPFHVPPDRLIRRDNAAESTNTDKFRLMVTAMDTEIGRLLDAMDPAVRDRTMIVILGDNGTDGRVVPPPIHGREAKFTLYEAGTGVPFVVSGAGVAARGSESQALVHAVDLFPTIADIAKVDPRQKLDGHSLKPLLADENSPWSRKVLYTERFFPNGRGPWTEHHVAVRDNRYKLMEVRKKGDKTETYLFDLRGRIDDGPNLLEGALNERAAAARKKLRKALNQYEQIPYAGN